MHDQYNRKIDYLRISLTDRCNLHCRYCQPEVSEHVTHNEILRYEELLRICRAALQLGIRNFKITGGEPLLRKGCSDFIANLKQLEGAEQVTLTTNGTLLSNQLPALIAAGVDSINVSLDTLDAAYYTELTGGSLDSVLQALQELQSAGIPFKLNCVPLAENGPADIMQLLKLAHRYNAPLRFIELMPLDCNANLRGVSGNEIRSLLLFNRDRSRNLLFSINLVLFISKGLYVRQREYLSGQKQPYDSEGQNDIESLSYDIKPKDLTALHALDDLLEIGIKAN